MPPRIAVLALLLFVALIALPACKKKKGDDDGDSPGSTNSGGTAGAGGLGLTEVIPGVMQSGRNNLKVIGLAFHNYHDAINHFPCGICGPDRKTAGLSWRVQILPYIEQDGLYRQFKLNEPWDSPHNKSLIGNMPKAYAPPGGYTPTGFTYYRAFSGPGTAMPPPTAAVGPGLPLRGLRIPDIRDGVSNTAFVVEAAEPVIWTKPEELPYNPKGPLPRVGGIFAEGTNVLMGDGSVRFLSKRQAIEQQWRALITANGGEILNLP